MKIHLPEIIGLSMLKSQRLLLPEAEYGTLDIVRKVSGNSGVIFKGKRYAIGRAFRGERIALRMTPLQAVWDVYYCQQRIGQIDQKASQKMLRRASDPLAVLAGRMPAV